MKRAASITELYHLTPDTPFQLRGQSYAIARTLTTNAITGEVFESPRTLVECYSYSTLIAVYDVRGETMYEHEDARNMSRTTTRHLGEFHKFITRMFGETCIEFAADPHECGRWDYSTGPLISPRSAWGVLRMLNRHPWLAFLLVSVCIAVVARLEAVL